MQSASLEKKVGLFVLAGLILVAVLMLQFSKGTSLFQPTYTLKLKTANVSGMARGASVQLSGVRIGHVSEIQLTDDGKSVTLVLEIREDVKVHSDARFAIDTAGFLGDQFVQIIPQENKGEILKDGAEVFAEEPFNIQEMARAAAGFINRIDQTAKRLGEAIDRVDRLVLNEQTLTNVSETFSNLRLVSTQAFDTVVTVQNLITTNRQPIEDSVSNLVHFTEELNLLAGDFRDFLHSQTGGVAAAVNNVESSTEVLKSLLQEIQSGKGLAGTLIKDEQMAEHVSLVASNLSVTTSNLNRLGLWGILWKREPREREPRTDRSIYEGRSPFK